MTNSDSYLFIKNLINRKYPRVYFKDIPQTDERLVSFTYGRLKIFESMKFMKLSLDTIVKAIHLDDFVHVKKSFGVKWELV